MHSQTPLVPCAVAARVGLALLVLGGASVALAGGGGGDHIGLPLKEIALHAVNLVVLLGVLGYFARGKIGPALDARRSQIAHDIEAAGKAEAEAKAQIDAIHHKLAGFEAELAALRSEAERGAADEHAAIVRKAQEEAAGLRRAAARSIADEVERARTSLRAEAAKAAVELATRAVVDQINDQDHQRLDREFLGAVSGGAQGVRNG
jgi:F0F1-type ATP synthase membrane subunit b/b'